MPEQGVLWTALPRMATAETLEIDVLVSPRLGLNAPPNTKFELSDFPEFEHWTKTLADRLEFKVEFADKSRHDAEAIFDAGLDDKAWDHVFRASTFVRPWSFRDLSDREIQSFSVRFITAYLRDLYTDIGRNYPTLPPPRGALDGFRETVGPVTDVRVKEERAPAPRADQDIPWPLPEAPPRPDAGPRGCLSVLWAWLERLGRALGPFLRRLPPPLRQLIIVLLGFLRALLEPEPQTPPDPTQPKVSLPRTVHPSPYVSKPPLGPASLPALEKLEQELAASKAIAPQPVQGSMAAALATRDVTFDFARAKRFYERPEFEKPTVVPPEAKAKPPVEKPKLDFHQALGALGDYPEAMRRLGMVVRLRFPRPATDPGSVRVIALWDNAMRESDVAPRTVCELKGNRFTAAHKAGSDFTDGVLDLAEASDRPETDAARFDLVQVDADGAALKAIAAAATLERVHQLEAEGVQSLDRPDRDTVPALRSGGLALVRADRGWYLHEQLVDAAAKQVPKPVAGEPAELSEELYAEDLVRGYRIEVKREGGKWLSLCERVGTYDLVDDTGKVVRQMLKKTDEGYVKRTSANSEDGEKSPLYVHEVLARWTGWSLVAQRPGKTLESKPGGPPHEVPDEPRNDPATEFRLVTNFKAKPGSLPRLRFGHDYSLRARCVDLSGEPLAALKPSAPETKGVTYRRFEPAGPPAPLALREFWPGESLERLVLRSDHDRASVEYDQQEMQAVPPDAAAHRTRHLFPPKTSQQMAELHGKLEDAFDGNPDVGYRISLRESGTFAESKIVDVKTVIVANPQPTIPFGTPVDKGDYWINTADHTLPSPYLPDPIAVGAALRGVPGLVDKVSGDALPVHQVRAGDDPTETEPLLQVPFSGKWPDFEAFRFRVAERTTAGPQRPHWDSDERLLTVYLGKSERAEVRYSSYVLPAALAAHGIWDWLDDGDPAKVLRGHAERGAHWMITPSRTLVLVHALQHPLEPASFDTLVAERTNLSQTSAVFDGTLKLHVPSTGRIDVLARWDEYLDDPDKGLRTEARESVACDFPVTEDWQTGMAFPPSGAALTTHEFGDTRHRMVRYLVRATSSFREYLRENIKADEMTRDTEPADIVEVSVLNSARPIMPNVLYAVPTFDWPEAPPPAGWGPKHTVRRGGGGLRVYLDRPWYQSGEGELLGVVLQGPDKLPDRLRSRYGLDAIWMGAPQREAVPLEPHHFVDPVEVREVRLAELPIDQKAVVVGFKPEWDDARKVWYCDIGLDIEKLPWNYWPFVRLAFVRFQPESLEFATVSKVVLGEFGQVAPERTLRLTWVDTTHVRATLAGRAPAGHAPRVAFRVQTTTVPAGREPDELDWDHAAGHDPDIDWQNFHQLVEGDDPDGDGTVRWDQVVQLPVPRWTQRMRLEVTEYEWLDSDEEAERGVMRVTYAAHVPLD